MTRSNLEISISIVLGERVDQALQSAAIGLPERLQMAALEAFDRQMIHREPVIARIREARLMLRNQGQFTFDNE